MAKNFSYNRAHRTDNPLLQSRCKRFCERNSIDPAHVYAVREGDWAELAFRAAHWEYECGSGERARKMYRSLDLICRRVFGGKGYNGTSNIDGGVVGLWH